MFNLNIRILVVDDMIAMRKLLIKMLRDIGFTDFTEASDGADGWQKLNDAKPPIDLVISDMDMPKSTGIDLLKRVRSSSRNKGFLGLPFIMITTEADQNQVLEAIEAGVSNYLMKPLDAEVLKAKLEATHAKFKA